MRRLDARSMGPVFLYLCWSFSELASSIYHTQSCSAAVTSCFLSSLCLLLLRLPLLLLVTVVRWEPSKMQVDHCHTCSCWPALGSHWKTDTKRAEANMKRCTWTWVPFQLLDLLHTTKEKKKRESGVQKWATNQPQPYMHSLMRVRLVAAVGSGSLVDE